MKTFELLDILIDIFDKVDKFDYTEKGVVLDIDKGYFFDLFFEYGYVDQYTERKTVTFDGDLIQIMNGDKFYDIQKSKWNDIKENKDDLNYLILMAGKDIKVLFDLEWSDAIKDILLDIKKGTQK